MTIRLQVQNVRYGTAKYKGTFQTMYRIGKEEGITRLWRCVSVCLALCIVAI